MLESFELPAGCPDYANNETGMWLSVYLRSALLKCVSGSNLQHLWRPSSKIKQTIILFKTQYCSIVATLTSVHKHTTDCEVE